MNDRITVAETYSYVLSVNDSETIDRWLVEFLLERGGTLVRANSTKHALFLLKNLYVVDGIITDLRRREHGQLNQKAGIELAASVRRLGYTTPIMLYSMNLAPAIKKIALEAGVNRIAVAPAEVRDWLVTVT